MMIHINQSTKYSHLYSMLSRVYNAQTLRMLHYNVGAICGWTSARSGADYTFDELERLDVLLSAIEKAKIKELEK